MAVGSFVLLWWRVTRYVLPVLWMTSCLFISQGCRRRRPAEAQRTYMYSLGHGYKLCAVIPFADQWNGRDYFSGA